jgi:hypothetical protein
MTMANRLTSVQPLAALPMFVLVIGVLNASAVPITIQNAGFESPAVFNGSYIVLDSTPAPEFWAAPGATQAGILDPNATHTAGGNAPQGENILVNQGGGNDYVYQTLAAMLVSGDYELSAQVGQLFSSPGDPPWGIALYAVGGGGGAALLGCRGTFVGVGCTGSTNTSDGTFRLETLTLNIAAGNANLGRNLQVRLYSDSNGNAFDDVKLNHDNYVSVPDSRVPDPRVPDSRGVPDGGSVLTLLGMSLLALGTLRWRAW